jgi:carboxyl-terminal processing protease
MADMRVRFRALVSALALSCLVLGAGAQTAPPTGSDPAPAAPAPALTKEQKDEVLKALEEVVTKQAFVPGVDLAKWPEFVEKQREAIDKSEKELDFSHAVNAALRDFGISHIRFITSRASTMRRRTTMIGVGVLARANSGGLVVTYVFPKSPADAAGIKNGETIVAVDGKVPDSPVALQGEDGSEATLKVKAATGEEREVRLKRVPHSLALPDTLTWVGSDAAVLKIHSFQRGYQRQEIEKLLGEAAKAKYLVLDLRSNGGGAVNNLNHLLSLLLPGDAEIGTFISRRNSERYASEHDGKVETDPVVIAKATTAKFKTRRGTLPPFAGKIAVLVNRGSASASEICAAALREHLKAPVVGTKSMGAVLASVYRRLPHGYEIQYPISDYVTRDGIRLEKNPVVPDVEVTERATDEKDPAVEKAIEKLREATVAAALRWRVVPGRAFAA